MVHFSKAQRIKIVLKVEFVIVIKKFVIYLLEVVQSMGCLFEQDLMLCKLNLKKKAKKRLKYTLS